MCGLLIHGKRRALPSYVWNVNLRYIRGHCWGAPNLTSALSRGRALCFMGCLLTCANPMTHNDKGVSMDGNVTTITDPTGIKPPRSFTYDYSYWSHDGFKTRDDGVYVGENENYASQDKVFDDLGKGTAGLQLFTSLNLLQEIPCCFTLDARQKRWTLMGWVAPLHSPTRLYMYMGGGGSNTPSVSSLSLLGRTLLFFFSFEFMLTTVCLITIHYRRNVGQRLDWIQRCTLCVRADRVWEVVLDGGLRPEWRHRSDDVYRNV